MDAIRSELAWSSEREREGHAINARYRLSSPREHSSQYLLMIEFTVNLIRWTTAGRGLGFVDYIRATKERRRRTGNEPAHVGTLYWLWTGGRVFKDWWWIHDDKMDCESGFEEESGKDAPTRRWTSRSPDRLRDWFSFSFFFGLSKIEKKLVYFPDINHLSCVDSWRCHFSKPLSSSLLLHDSSFSTITSMSNFVESRELLLWYWNTLSAQSGHSIYEYLCF